MSGIKDGTKISEISIPGTHDSCARFEYQLIKTQCQWFSIIQQLNRGIRFLDIRCRYKADDEVGRTQGIFFPIHHATTFQNILFEEVQAQCIAFLSDNPTEFILMNVQMEYDCFTNDDGCSDLFREKFLELTAPYQQKHWYMKNSIPKIDECRGRIVLIRAYDPDPNHKKPGWASGIDPKDPNTYKDWPDGVNGGGLEWNGFSEQNDGESENAIFKTQNGWTKWSGTKKGEKVEDYIEAAQANAAAGYITLNFASYASDRGPGPNAQGMNERLQGFLKNYRPNGIWGVALGVIPIDFIGNTGDGGDSFENLIIEHQMCQDPTISYGGIAPWLLEASAPGEGRSA
jgi:1-phosphatidylinositol phosphodiesterase